MTVAIIRTGPVSDTHPSRDRSRRFARDAMLRNVGYTIHSRPKHGEALWLLDGVLYTESQAVESVLWMREIDRAAEGG